MIEQGTDIEAKDPGAGASALHYAVMKGEMPLVGLLVQRGADVNSRTKSGTTPLHTAVLYGRLRSRRVPARQGRGREREERQRRDAARPRARRELPAHREDAARARGAN